MNDKFDPFSYLGKESIEENEERKTKYKVQTIEVNEYGDVHCLFCGKRIIFPMSINEGGEYFTECPHVLFWGNEAGAEFVADKFKGNLAIIENMSKKVCANDWNSITDKIDAYGAVKIEICYGSGVTGFIVLAPRDEDEK